MILQKHCLEPTSVTGSWQPGWVITEIRGEELKVQKDGITLWVEQGNFTSPDQYLEVGKKGHIWMLKEWRELLPGYYTALGNESDDFEEKFLLLDYILMLNRQEH